MSLMQKIRLFVSDKRASVSVEAVMVFPLLFWAYFGMFILFDGYRAMAANNRAAYTISDLISRETNAITPEYMEGLNDMLDILTQSQYRTVLRVTVASYNATTDDHTMVWSYSTEGQDAITTGNFDDEIVQYLPPMPDGGVLVAVETWMGYVPFSSIALDSFYFESMVTIRPRFAGQLVFES